MSNAEKKAAKKAAKAEKKANNVSNPEMTKAIISAVTAVLCVVAIIITSFSITGQILDANLKIAEQNAKVSGPVSNAGVSNDAPVVDDSTAPGDDVVVDDSTVPGDDVVVDDTTVPSDDTAADTNTSATDKKPETTNKAETTGAPVGNDIAKIVAYYNAAANATKAYKGTMKLTIVQGSSSKITKTSFPQAAVGIAEGLLPNDYPTNKTFTVTNGQGKGFNERKNEEENKSINDILAIDGNVKMSTLTAAGVQSASCTKSGNNYKVVIKLKPETVYSFDEKPKHHSACMDVLNISSSDIKPFEARKMEIKYTGATLTAVITDKNLLAEYDVNEPMDINGTLGWTFIEGTATIAASWQQNVKFAY